MVKNDHAGLASFYLNEATRLQKLEKDMAMMVEAYQKDPGPSSRGVLPPPKLDFAYHCQALEPMYGTAADEANTRARCAMRN